MSSLEVCGLLIKFSVVFSYGLRDAGSILITIGSCQSNS